MRILDFSDGFQSSSSPTLGDINANSLRVYASDALFLADKFANPNVGEDGDIYFNSALNVIRYWIGPTNADFATLIDSVQDHDLAGSIGLPTIGANKVLYTNGSSKIVGETALDETRGGTAQTAYAQGDVLYASAANTLTRLPVGSNGYVLTVDTGLPTWAPAGGVAYQEVPIGSVNGSNPNFGPLTYLPSDDASIWVYVDRVLIPNTGWVHSAGVISFQAGFIPQLDQTVYVVYLYNGIPTAAPPPVASGTQNRGYHLITAGELTAKSFTLPATPADVTKVFADIIGGGAQHYGIDFSVIGNNFQWSGLGMDGVVDTTTVIRFDFLT
jgi:hypothetical protein